MICKIDTSNSDLNVSEEARKRELEDERRKEQERIAAQLADIEAKEKKVIFLRCDILIGKVPLSREERRRKWQEKAAQEAAAKASSQPFDSIPKVPSQQPTPVVSVASDALAASPPQDPPAPAKLESHQKDDSSEFDMFDIDADVEIPARPLGYVRGSKDVIDDAEGYYRPQVGEILHERYKVIGHYGQGCFAFRYYSMLTS